MTKRIFVNIPDMAALAEFNDALCKEYWHGHWTEERIQELIADGWIPVTKTCMRHPTKTMEEM
jgi:hypothetical protein